MKTEQNDIKIRNPELVMLGMILGIVFIFGFIAFCITRL